MAQGVMTWAQQEDNKLAHSASQQKWKTRRPKHEGKTYFGNWQRGKMHGKGRLVYADG